MDVGIQGINEAETSNCRDSFCDSKFYGPDFMVQIYN